MDPQEAPRQNTTIERFTKLGFYKVRDMAVPFALPGKERFQVPGDDCIERIVFRIARPVRGVDSHEGVA
jgi:hypothetical protein